MTNLFKCFSILCTLFCCYAVCGEVKIVNDVSISPATPEFPDLSQVTAEVIAKKRAQLELKEGHARLAPLTEFRQESKVFYSSIFENLAQSQQGIPRLIVIENGHLDVESLHMLLPSVVTKEGSSDYTLSVPLFIMPGASFSTIPRTTLKLSESDGAFIFNIGQLFIEQSTVLGWRKSTQSPSRYTSIASNFRPFILGYSGSNMFISESRFESLGFNEVGAYGISLKSISDQAVKEVSKRTRLHYRTPPSAWIINSEFSDLYFGFYCSEAENVALLNNGYHNSLIYGIDVRDKSKSVIIADNKVTNTKTLHGIIASRNVTSSFVFRNYVSGSLRSGIVIDRQSKNNIVAFNKVTSNRGDGITIYESPDVMVYGNQVYKNRQHGIRTRNSENVTLVNNIVLGNRGSGVYFHSRDLSKTDENRDLVRDPYTQSTTGTVIGGLIAGNNTSAIYSENTRELKLDNIAMEQNGNGKNQLSGDLLNHEAEILLHLWHKRMVKFLGDDSSD